MSNSVVGREPTTHGGRRFGALTVLPLLLLWGLVAIPLSSSPRAAKAAAPTSNMLRLRVESAREWIPSGLHKGDAIPKYHWLVVEDDTGDPSHYGTNLGAADTKNSNFACTPQSLGGDPAYPANCQWPSIHSIKGGTSAEVVAQGDETTLNETTPINTSGWPANDHNPNHSYMISVTADGYDVPGCTPSATVTCHADGFKIDGGWFSTPIANNGLVTVDLQPYPLPLTTVRMKVWNDTQTNGAFDTGEQPLQGFEGHLDDVLGPVTDDWYGNPICTVYQHDSHGLMLFGTDGKPLIQTIGGHCFSDADGVITVPYLGPNRFASTVTAPNGQTWYQTSTLEGWHDWDTWSIEGWNGYDPEFVQGAEPFPFAEFGFVQVQTKAGLGVNSSGCCNYASPAATGSIKGTVVGIGEYSPQVGGLGFGGNGKHIIENINQPLVSLIDTGRNDDTVYVGRGNADGTFNITNVPDGDYVLETWDEDQAYLLTGTNVSVVGGQAIDMGVLDVAAWHSQVFGKVCNDTNRNGKCDPGEPGIPNLDLSLLGRDNSVQFYGDNKAKTDSNGNYRFPRTYPLGQWVVTQGYWEQFYTVGVTYQTENQPAETTVMANGGFVDVSSFNLIGHQTRMDWAVHPYESAANANLGPTNGGIVGEVVATTTRNELDPRYQATESYEPGLPGATVHLYAPVKCVPSDVTTIPAGTTCTQETTAFGSSYYLTDAVDGSIKRLSDGPDKVSGNPIDLYAPYTSETWKRPTDCTARGADGSQVVEQVLPPTTGGHDCLEAPMMSSQVGNNSVGPFMQVNGNYGFTQIDHNPTTGEALPNPVTIPPGDFIVKVDSPKDFTGAQPAYEVVKEEDVNIFSGDKFVAPGETPLDPPLPNRTPPATVVPAIPPFPCAGADHTVNVVSDLSLAKYDVTDPANPAKTGVYNPDMAAGGGSPYQGQQKPLCDSRLVTVRNGRSATPNFHFKTFSGFDAAGKALPAGAGVPLPGRIFGIAVDDVNLSTNPKELFYGEKYGIPNMPIGIYDFSNRLVKTIQTDPQGAYEVILPSTSSYNCPVPAGPCPGIYRFLANDPGQPGHLNPGYNAAYRTIGGFFEVWPGVSLPSDLAPTPVSFAVENPGTQQTHPAACAVNDPGQPTAPKVPEFFSVSPKPYTNLGNAADRTFTINGQDFGTSPGQVLFDGTPVDPSWIQTWTDTAVTVVVPTTAADGPHQVLVRGANGKTSANGVTYHVLDSGYNPRVFEVGPGLTGTDRFSSTDPNPTFAAHAVQRALDAAAATTGSRSNLVVVYPNTPGAFNPFGSYFENIVIHSRLKLQGVGPGGLLANGNQVPGTVLDGVGYGTDGAREAAWAATVASIGTIIGPNGVALDPAVAAVPEGEVVLAVATSATQYGVGKNSPKFASIDGMTVQNGDVMDFVPNVNTLGNGAQVGGGNNTPTNPNQGGGIVAFASTTDLQITNNVIKSNAGAYGGAIRVGTPLVGDNHNDNITISSNRILNNGGTNLAGAVGIFSGAYGYEIKNNDLCGNFSNEYGGAISHFGLTGNLTAAGARPTNPSNGNPSSIHDNRIYFNGSYDEGGGVIIAGEPPATATSFGAGAGPVDIYNNLIEANLANDDGGGLRFLTAGNFPYNVYNNMIVNNISTHEGGGVAIDNAPNVRFYNNTVAKNLTTATAATSNGTPAPAGLSTAPNNVLLQATLPPGSPLFSNPLQFNNVFWDNRAGTWNPSTGVISGIGATGDASPLNHWDMGVPGTPHQLSPTSSVLQSETVNHNDVVASPNNKVDQDPLFSALYETSVSSLAWRGNPNFVASVIVAQDVPVSIMGDYHLSGTASPAFNAGAASKAVPAYQQPANTLPAPAFDIDNQVRPALGSVDSGADEFPGAQADLSITKSDGATTVAAGGTVTYTIGVANNGPAAVALAPVVDNVPAFITGATWTCTAPGGSTCGAASGTGNINTTVNLPNGGSATFTLTGTVSVTANGNLVNTATITPPAGTSDPTPANNSATDTDAIVRPVDLSITKTDGVTVVSRGNPVRYTIVVSNNGPNPVTGAIVNDNFPGNLAGLSGTINWTCTPSAGATCGGAGTGNGTINRTVNLAVGSTLTFMTTSGSVSANTLLTSLSNTATVSVPAGYVDTNTVNNSATDTDAINGLHIASLSGTSTATSATQWSASVVVTVHDSSHNPVSGATVSGSWIFGGTGGTSCTTTGTGQCTLTRTGLSRSTAANVMFTVLGVSRGPDGYQFTLNEVGLVATKTVARP